MPFATSELHRIKAELGRNLLETGADVYVGVHQDIDVVVQTYIEAEVVTTAVIATAITAASTPTPQTITLTSATGFAEGDRIVLDVDTRREWATIQSLSGTSAVVHLSKAHSGTIPVGLEGPIEIARDNLARIRDIKDRLGSTFGWGALKAVDEIEFYQSGGTQFEELGSQLSYWRGELAAALGVANLWEQKRSAGCSVALY